MQQSSWNPNNSSTTTSTGSTPYSNNQFYQPATVAPPYQFQQSQQIGVATYPPQPTAPQTPQEQKQMPMKLEDIERFQKLAPDEKYVFIIEQGQEDPKVAIKLLAIWLKSIDQKKTA